MVSGSEGDLAVALTRKLGAERGRWALRQVHKAADNFASEYHRQALAQLRPVMDTEAADVPEVRELHGLILYRLRRWRAAARELEAFAALTLSCEQAPVLADCYRAQQRWEKVAELWDDLRRESPSAELVTEGRIVAAGALADQGRPAEAVALLADGWRTPRNPGEFHLRRPMPSPTSTTAAVISRPPGGCSPGSSATRPDSPTRPTDSPTSLPEAVRGAATAARSRLRAVFRVRRARRSPTRGGGLLGASSDHRRRSVEDRAADRLRGTESPAHGLRNGAAAGDHRGRVALWGRIAAGPARFAIRRQRSRSMRDIAALLGDDADYLLGHTAKAIPAEDLHLPGPDFVDRVVAASDRSPQVLRNLQALFGHGRLAGTGYVSILPVDQGVEHSGAASFAPNPAYFDPENIVRLASEGGCNAVASTFGVLGAVARRWAHRIPFIV